MASDGVKLNCSTKENKIIIIYEIYVRKRRGYTLVFEKKQIFFSFSLVPNLPEFHRQLTRFYRPHAKASRVSSPLFALFNVTFSRSPR